MKKNCLFLLLFLCWNGYAKNLEEIDEQLSSFNYVSIETSYGSMVIELYVKEAPKNVNLFRGLVSGEYSWVNIEGDSFNTPYYDGRVVSYVFPGTHFLLSGEGKEFYQWVGYEVPDEIYKNGELLRGLIDEDKTAGLVWGEFFIPQYDKTKFIDKEWREAKGLYNAVLERKNFKPIYGKSVGSLKEVTRSNKEIYKQVLIREPQKGDVFMHNIGTDTAYGVIGFYTNEIHGKKPYTIIGHVLEGMEVLDSIDRSILKSNAPLSQIVFKKLKLHKTLDDAKRIIKK